MVAVREIDEGRPVGVRRAYRGGPAAARSRCCSPRPAIAVVLIACTATVVLIPVAVVALVLCLLVTPVVLFEGCRVGGRHAQRALVRQRWVKVVVLVALTTCLGARRRARCSAPCSSSARHCRSRSATRSRASSTRCSIPLVALNTLYVYADVVVREQIDPPADTVSELPAEATLA